MTRLSASECSVPIAALFRALLASSSLALMLGALPAVPFAVAQESPCPTFASSVGRLGGVTADVAVAEGRAYLAVGTGIRVVPLDGVSGEEPLPVEFGATAELRLPAVVADLQVDEEHGLLVAVTKAGGLHVYGLEGDLPQPLAAVTLGAEAPDIALWDGRIFAHSPRGIEPRLRVFSLAADPSGGASRLVQVGSLEHPPAGPYFIHEGMLYANDHLLPSRERGIVAIDVRNPAAPVVTGGVAFEGRLRDMTFGDGLAYGATFGSGPVVFDLSDPTRPEPIAVIETPRAGLEHVLLTGSMLIGSSSSTLYTYDLSDPRSPVLHSLHSRGATIRGLTLDGARPVIAADGLLEVLAGGFAGSQATRGRYLFYARASYGGRGSLLRIGDRLFAESLGQSLHSLAFDGDDQLRERGAAFVGWSRISLDLVQGRPGLLWATGSNGFVGGLVAIDVGTEDRPHVQSNIALPGAPGAPAVLADRVFVNLSLTDVPLPEPADGLRLAVFDATDPSSPVVLDDIRPPGTILAFHGTVGYHKLGSELRPMELTDPAAPVFAPPIVLEDHVNDALVHGGRLLLATRNGLEVLDLSDPMAPLRIGRVEVPGSILARDGHCLFLADASRAVSSQPVVHVLELDAEDLPRIVGQLPLTGIARTEGIDGLAVADGLLFAAAPDIHILALDRIVPTATPLPSPPPPALPPPSPTAIATATTTPVVPVRIAIPWALR